MRAPRLYIVVSLLMASACKSKESGSVDAGLLVTSASASSAVPGVDAGSPKALGPCTAEKGSKFALRFPAAERRSISDIASDPCGNILLVGSYRKSISLGGDPLEAVDGKEDLFLAKFGPDGAHIFSKRIGGKGKQQVRAIGTDAKGDIYLTGTLDGPLEFGSLTRKPAPKGSSFFVAHFSPDGEHLFSRVLFDEAPGAVPTAMVVDKDGNMVVAGRFSRQLHLADSPPYSSGLGGMFLAKYNAYAAHRWSKVVLSDKFPGSINANAVALDKEGNMFVAGSFENEADFGKGKIRSAGKRDMFLAKYSLPTGDPPASELAWVKRFGDGDANSGQAVVADAEGNVYFAGSNDRKVPGEPVWKVNHVVELWKFDSSGKKLWPTPKYFGGGVGKEGVEDPVLAVSGTTLAVAGTITENTNVGSQTLDVPKGQKWMFVSVFDGGKGVWSEASELELPAPRSMLLTAGKEILITGSTATKPLPGVGPFGIFLQKFLPTLP